MSERDQSPAGPRPEWPAQPPVDWRADTTPGLQHAGSGPFSGAGASPAGAGGSGARAGRGQDDSGAGHVGRHGYQDQSGTSGYQDQSGTSGYQDQSGTSGHQGQGDTSGYPDQSGTSGYPDRDDRRETAPQYSTSPVRVRRPDVLAGLLLVLAGIAAGISLLLDWVQDANGWDLVENGFEDFGADSWPFPVIAVAGGALLVLGLLMFLPARNHRTLGVLALLATLAALCAVVVLLQSVQWNLDPFEAGFWAACAVPALGLLGSLKAMLTNPKLR